MQSQKQKLPTSRPVGELLVAWLLILAGFGSALPGLIVAVGILAQYRSAVELALFAPWPLAALLCGCGGLASLWRQRHLAQGLVLGAAFLLFLYASFYAYYLRHNHSFSRFVAMYCLGIASIAAFLFFLGRWLGSREASKEVG